MADLTDAKDTLSSVYPLGAAEHTWTYLEPLITPDILRSTHLWGIELVGQTKDPRTGRRFIMEDPVLKTQIEEAVALAELETGLDIFPKKIEESAAFDRAEYKSFGYLTLKHRPVSAILSMTITPTTGGSDIWTIPNDWIDTSLLGSGQLNLMPLTVSATTGQIPSAHFGATILQWFMSANWVPAFWRATYIAGFRDAKIPKPVNQLIGIIASMEILSILASTNAKSNSMSLSIDGLSQSTSTGGGAVYQQRYAELQEKKKDLVKRLKRMFALGMFSDNW